MPSSPFVSLFSDTSKSPHRFEAHRYDSSHSECQRMLKDACLGAWRITAVAFYQAVEETGFRKLGLDRLLNVRGRSRLPDTPKEDTHVTAHHAITDMTEALSVLALKHLHSGLVVPYPRVLHKDRPGEQHHGIDLLGYRVRGSKTTLYVVEVAASVDRRHPPSVVRAKLKQLLVETLNEKGSARFMDDLTTVHDECKDDGDRDVLNAFIVSASDGMLLPGQAITGTAVLVRRRNEVTKKDWEPFLKRRKRFEEAILPAAIWFVGLECYDTFSGLLNEIKTLASGSTVDDKRTG